MYYTVFLFILYNYNTCIVFCVFASPGLYHIEYVNISTVGTYMYIICVDKVEYNSRRTRGAGLY